MSTETEILGDAEKVYVPLYADIKKIGAALVAAVPTHVPTPNDLAGAVGGIIAYLEHGQSIIDAARTADLAAQSGHDAISSVLTQNQPAPAAGDVQVNADQQAFNVAQEQKIRDLMAAVERLSAQVESDRHETSVAQIVGAAPVATPSVTPPPAPAASPAPVAPEAAIPGTSGSFGTAPEIPVFGGAAAAPTIQPDTPASPVTAPSGDQEGAA